MPTLVPVAELTRQASSLYRTHWVAYLRVLVWILVPSILKALIPLFPTSEQNRIILDGTLSLLIGIISLWLSVVLVDLVLKHTGRGPDTKKIGKGSWGTAGRVVDFFLVSLLQGVVVVLGTILFIIPGIIFAVWFSFARYAVLVDGVSPGSQALRASKQLVTGRFWPVLWRWAGSYLYFGSFLVLGTAAVLALIGFALGNPGLAFADTVVPVWWSALLVNVVSILATPLFVVIGVLLYENAKRPE